MKKVSFGEKVEYFSGLRLNIGPEGGFDREFMPDDESQAYAIQNEVVQELGFKVLAWKLGGTNPKTQANFDCTSAYLGPIFSLGDEKPAFFDSAAPRGEAELTFRLSDKIRSLDSNGIKGDPMAYFDAVYPSLEMPYSRINDFHEVGMLPLVADLCGTGHLVVGDAKHLALLQEHENIPVRIGPQEQPLACGSSLELVGGYQAALVDFLKLVLKYDIQIEAGQLVASGGVTPCVYLPVNNGVEIDFSSLGCLSVCYP